MSCLNVASIHVYLSFQMVYNLNRKVNIVFLSIERKNKILWPTGGLLEQYCFSKISCLRSQVTAGFGSDDPLTGEGLRPTRS